MQEWKMIGLAALSLFLSLSMDEIMKLYGWIFLYSNPLDSF